MPVRPPVNTTNAKTPWDFIQLQRLELLQLDEAALASLAKSYASATEKAFRELEAVIKQIERALENGDPVHPNWLWRQQRWTALLLQMGDEMARFGGDARDIIDRLGTTSAHMGGDHAAIRLEMVGPNVSFQMLPREALDMMVANLRARAPAGALLNGIAQTARNELQSVMFQLLKTELTNGIAVGRNPRDVARSMYAKTKDHLDGLSYRRAELIARTESMRMYRAAQTENYRNNDDVVLGWIWVASLNVFTCPACLAKHMTQHPLSEEMESHPACRCTAMPFVDDERPNLPFGDEWLRAQSTADQQKIMGSPERWRMWNDGEISLADCAKETKHPVWGKSVTVTPIRDLKRIADGQIPSRPNAVWNPLNEPISVPIPAKPVKPDPEPTPKITLRDNSNLKGDESMNQFEAITRKQSGDNGYESAAGYDRSGRALFIKDGDDAAVGFDADEIAMLKGGILTHNHPYGSSFSEADFVFFTLNELHEIRAVGEQFTYSLRGIARIKMLPDATRTVISESMRRRWYLLREESMNVWRDKVISGELDSDEAWRQHSHWIMERLSSEFGLQYERTPAHDKPNRRFHRLILSVFRRLFVVSQPA